jgi:hypothetical protein
MVAVSSLALADGVEQMQGFLVGLTNSANLLVSSQTAASNNFIGFLNDQSVVSASQTTQGADVAMSQMGIMGNHSSWTLPSLTVPMVSLPTFQTVSFNSLASQMPAIPAIQFP